MASQNPETPSGKEETPKGGNGKQQGSPSSSSSGKSPPDEEYYSSFLCQLLEVMGHADETSVSRVIAAVRSGASHDQVLELVREISKRTSPLRGSA